MQIKAVVGLEHKGDFWLMRIHTESFLAFSGANLESHGGAFLCCPARGPRRGRGTFCPSHSSDYIREILQRTLCISLFRRELSFVIYIGYTLATRRQVTRH